MCRYIAIIISIYRYNNSIKRYNNSKKRINIAINAIIKRVKCHFPGSVRNQQSVDVLRFIIICQTKCSEVLSGYKCGNARNQATKRIRVYDFPVGPVLNVTDSTCIQHRRIKTTLR